MIYRIVLLLFAMTVTLAHAAAVPLREPSADPRDFEGVWVARGGAHFADGLPAAAIEADAGSCAPEQRLSGADDGATNLWVMGEKIVLMLSEEGMNTRRIYLSAEHPDATAPEVTGQSVGHWDGDTLVVETMSGGQRVVERIARVQTGGLWQLHTDGQVTANGRTRQFEATQVWRPDVHLYEDVCEERLEPVKLSNGVVSAPQLGQLVQGGGTKPAPKVDLTGPWQLATATPALKTLEGQLPPMRAETMMRFQVLHEKKSPTTSCLPPGVPRLSLQPFPWMIVQGKRYVVFVHEWNHLFRVVTMDGEHVENMGRTFLGQSTGQWADKALVVTTNGFNDRSVLDDSGLPHSPALQTVERYKLTKGGNVLELDLTVADAFTYLKSWDTRLLFKKLPGTVLRDDYCLQRTGATH
jgi:hypothetical protein